VKNWVLPRNAYATNWVHMHLTLQPIHIKTFIIDKK